jgi:hypothetical protein
MEVPGRVFRFYMAAADPVFQQVFLTNDELLPESLRRLSVRDRVGMAFTLKRPDWKAAVLKALDAFLDESLKLAYYTGA